MSRVSLWPPADDPRPNREKTTEKLSRECLQQVLQLREDLKNVLATMGYDMQAHQDISRIRTKLKDTEEKLQEMRTRFGAVQDQHYNNLYRKQVEKRFGCSESN